MILLNQQLKAYQDQSVSLVKLDKMLGLNLVQIVQNTCLINEPSSEKRCFVACACHDKVRQSAVEQVVGLQMLGQFEIDLKQYGL